jgi:hypothetical protein
MVKVFYQSNGKFRVYDTETFTFSWETNFNRNEGFFVFKGYAETINGKRKITDNSLLKFLADFTEWCKELKNNKIFKHDYASFKCHRMVTEVLFRKLRIEKVFAEMENIDQLEFSWMERCNCSALIKLFIEKGTIIDSWGVDFRGTYPHILGDKDFSFRIPIKRGKEYTLKEIDFKKLTKGYYHIIISSDDENFNKVFNYCKNNVYTDISIYQAFMYQRDHNMKINFELVQDGKPNCYLYDKTICCYTLFQKWYDVVKKLKDELPHNKLVKHLSSALWGYLCKYNRRYMTVDEIVKEDLAISWNTSNTNVDYYKTDEDSKGVWELIDAKQPFTHMAIARLKPFLLSKARMMTGNIMLSDIENVIRIHTDNVTFSKPHPEVLTMYSTYPELRVEDKTTGSLRWVNVNYAEDFNNTETQLEFMKDLQKQMKAIYKI